ncbi:MAG: hypothetical protein K0U41_03750 [Gammaproteobacteria bacterium]|nr:hypothetical protein [Gammaproteobacteria bacterium]
MVQVNTFDGGLATRVHESLLNVNQAHELVNVDPNSAVLKSACAFRATTTPMQERMYYFKGKWHQFHSTADFVEYQGRLVYIVNGEIPRVLVNNEAEDHTPIYLPYNLGITKPDDTETPMELSREELYIPSTHITYLNHASTTYGPAKTVKVKVVAVTTTIHNGDRCELKVEDLNVEFIDRTLIAYLTLGDRANIYEVYREEGGKYYRTHTIMPNSNNGLINDRVQIRRDAGYITSLDEYVATSGTSAGGNVDYAITFLSEITGYESQPIYTESINVACDQQVVISNLPTPLPNQGVTHYNIYKRGIYTTSLALIDTIPVDRTAYTNNAIASPGGEILSLGALNHQVPVAGMHSLVEAYGTFFTLLGDTLRWSENKKPYSWPVSQSLTLREEGTGLLIVPQGLLVFTRNFTYILTGTDLSDFNLSIVSTNQGCLSNRSCQLVKNSPVWVSHDGICSLANGYAQVLSRPILGRISLDVQQTVVFDEQYYVLETNGNILVLDLRSNLRFYRLRPSVRLTDLHVYNGALYASDGSHVYDIGSEQLPMTYVSPVFIEGNHTVEKNYNQLFFRSDGEFTVEFRIDGVAVATDQVAGNKAHIITPPSGQSKGTSSQVKITGTGIVYAFDTQPSGEREGGIQ